MRTFFRGKKIHKAARVGGSTARHVESLNNIIRAIAHTMSASAFLRRVPPSPLRTFHQMKHEMLCDVCFCSVSNARGRRTKKEKNTKTFPFHQSTYSRFKC